MEPDSPCVIIGHIGGVEYWGRGLATRSLWDKEDLFGRGTWVNTVNVLGQVFLAIAWVLPLKLLTV